MARPCAMRCVDVAITTSANSASLASTILSFLEDRLEDVVYVEQVHGLSRLEAADERAPYEQTITEVKRVAPVPEESVESVVKALTSQE